MKEMKSLFLLLLCAFSANSLANITLSKNRLFFDSTDRADALQLRNTGASPMQFTTKMFLIQMDELGGMTKIEASDYSAINMVRFSPKRGVVPVNGKQVIRFSVRRPKDLPTGEYRAVLSVSTSLAADKPEAVTLNSTLSYNMPLIVRHGNTSAQTSLENTRIVNTANNYAIELWQTLKGNRSLYGNYTVEDSAGQVVGVLNGVAVYTPLNKRKVLIPLNVDNVNQELVVKYQELAAFGGIEKAQTIINL